MPAINASRHGALRAIASRDVSRARALAGRHRVGTVHESYEALLADPEVDAIYLPLVNSLHREWTLRALQAGKHVLCEKPLALNAAEGEEMAAAARSAGRILMEAFMYRFHPRMRRLRETAKGVRYLQASFGFPLRDEANYRLQPELGGGALLDVGCYGLDVARWLLGEPDKVVAVLRPGPTGVDLSASVLLGFPGGATASVWGSFESPEQQELLLVTESDVVRLERPFTAWKDPHDPYRLMVDEFAAAALSGSAPPLPLEDSLAGLRLLDRVRAAAGP